MINIFRPPPSSATQNYERPHEAPGHSAGAQLGPALRSNDATGGSGLGLPLALLNSRPLVACCRPTHPNGCALDSDDLLSTQTAGGGGAAAAPAAGRA